jgi:hypothetical protein
LGRYAQNPSKSTLKSFSHISRTFSISPLSYRSYLHGDTRDVVEELVFLVMLLNQIHFLIFGLDFVGF